MTRVSNIAIKISNLPLNEVPVLEFLGVIPYNKLKWNEHTDSMNSKVSVLTFFLYRLRYCLNEKC